jgi:simple sugar transport system ATP-binding protein
LDGEHIEQLSIRERIEKGLGYIPEDRRKYGVVGEFSIAENSAIKSYYKSPFRKKFGILDFEAMKKEAEHLIDQFDIRSAEGPVTKAGSLSGGNQQKVIVAREISLSPKVLVVAQPTRGLDVGAIEYIRKRIIDERMKGRAILLVSLELDEIMNLCDRIATISKGSIVAVNKQHEVTEREIGMMMAGSHKEAQA